MIVDVLVAGAGVAGGMVAISLAGKGLRVLVVDDASPVTGPAPHVLITAADRETLAPVAVPLWSAGELEIVFGPGRRQVVAEPGAWVCDVGRLRNAIRAALPDVLPGRVTGVSGQRVTVRTAAGSDVEVVARHVVSATGADPKRAERITRARRYRVAAPLSVRLHLVRPADPRHRPSFVRVVPGLDGTVTVTRTGDEDLTADLLPEVGLAGAVPVGPLWLGAADTGFTPDAAVVDGIVRVGDAAGLVNPFSGDGISYALDSATLAVRSVLENPADREAAAMSYRRRLSSAFVGYFETARHGARRYQLAWRVLESTSDDDGPLFTKGRKAILLPDGLRQAVDERLRLSTVESARLLPFLAATDELAVNAVRREWPFLGRLLVSQSAGTGRTLRPALLFAGSVIAAGGVLAPELAPVAAAIELATLGTFAFLGPDRDRAERDGRPTIDWARTTSLLAGDFLLGQAGVLVAAAAPALSWAFAEWLAELTAARAARLTSSAPAAEMFAALFEFPARMGAAVAGAGPVVTAALREVGHSCGAAFLLAEDVLALSGGPTRLDATTAGMVARRISSLPELFPGYRDCPVEASAVVTRARDAAHDAAQAAVNTLPAGVGADLLRRFVAAVAREIRGAD